MYIVDISSSKFVREDREVAHMRKDFLEILKNPMLQNN